MLLNQNLSSEKITTLPCLSGYTVLVPGIEPGSTLFLYKYSVGENYALLLKPNRNEKLGKFNSLLAHCSPTSMEGWLFSQGTNFG